MATGDLTTGTNAAAWIGDGVSATDATLTRLISAVSAQIKQFLSYDVLTGSYDETYSGRGATRMMLRQMPVTAVSSLQIDGQAIPASTSPTQAGFVFDDISIALRGYTFCRGVQNVAISYTAGWATTPLDIEQAALEWIKVMWDRKDRAADVLLQRSGDTEQRFNLPAGAQIASVMGAMPPAVRLALAPYARVFPA